jgi:kynurenine 3-monooxygenase
MENQESSNQTIKVVIVGAGPAGLLAAIFLLRRNLVENAQVKYQVTLVDPGVDYGKLDEDGLKKVRSWMIGLTAHGLSSIKEVPGLYDDYISNVGVHLTGATIGMGPKFKIEYNLTGEEKRTLGFLVDRNYICSGLARYLNDHFQNSKTSAAAEFVSHYNTKALFVDAEKQCIFVRSNDDGSTMVPLDYDILLGCDGIRSVVRNAFLTNHRDFEFDLTDNFGSGKAVHIKRPKDVEEGRFMILLNCMPNITAFCLPERGGKLNFAAGYTLDKPCDPDLLSKDPAVVAAYAKKHFKIFDMDFEEFAEEWVGQREISNQMVHCNFYHSKKLRALLLGDAAHATVPNIGQGMNTALKDASVLNSLLDTYGDDWDQVFPAFSEARVKEGNALTELSFHTFSIDSTMMMLIVSVQGIHRFLNRMLPTWLLELEPMNEIAKGMKLSDAYDKMMKYGYMARSRRINKDIMRSYFERKVGMVKERKRSSKMRLFWCAAVVGVVTYALRAKWYINGISM